MTRPSVHDRSCIIKQNPFCTFFYNHFPFLTFRFRYRFFCVIQKWDYSFNRCNTGLLWRVEYCKVEHMRDKSKLLVFLLYIWDKGFSRTYKFKLSYVRSVIKDFNDKNTFFTNLKHDSRQIYHALFLFLQVPWDHISYSAFKQTIIFRDLDRYS